MFSHSTAVHLVTAYFVTAAAKRTPPKSCKMIDTKNTDFRILVRTNFRDVCSDFIYKGKPSPKVLSAFPQPFLASLDWCNGVCEWSHACLWFKTLCRWFFSPTFSTSIQFTMNSDAGDLGGQETQSFLAVDVHLRGACQSKSRISLQICGNADKTLGGLCTQPNT